MSATVNNIRKRGRPRKVVDTQSVKQDTVFNINTVIGHYRTTDDNTPPTDIPNSTIPPMATTERGLYGNALPSREFSSLTNDSQRGGGDSADGDCKLYKDSSPVSTAEHKSVPISTAEYKMVPDMIDEIKRVVGKGEIGRGSECVCFHCRTSYERFKSNVKRMIDEIGRVNENDGKER